MIDNQIVTGISRSLFLFVCIRILNTLREAFNIYIKEVKVNMSVIKSINLLLAFLLELCLLAIFGYWGVALASSMIFKIILGAAFPVILALVWGKFLAPTSSTRLKEPRLSIVKVIIFSLAALALLSIGKGDLGIWFWLVSMLNLILLYNYSR